MSDSVSSISKSSEESRGSGPKLERTGLGLGTRARAHMHVPGGKRWYLIPGAAAAAYNTVRLGTEGFLDVKKS